MNIILVGDGFTGATLPLVKRWAKLGHNVYCFYYVRFMQKGLEGFDFPQSNRLGIHKITLEDTNLATYMPANVHISQVVLLRERQKLKKTGLNNIINYIDNITELNLAKRIISLNYDAVNVVGHFCSHNVMLNLLDKRKVYCSVHEVLDNHLKDSWKLNKYTNYLIDNRYNIIVHSHFSQSKIKHYNLSYYIPFGAFETINLRDESVVDKLPVSDNYFLFYGYVLPYKGLHLLYDAYQLLKSSGHTIPLVIAGKGEDEYLDLFKQESTLTVMNQFLSNDSLKLLIQKCKAVVCPYLSASQSGIPQTVNQFGKKIIATDVGAFPEFIYEGENGYIVHRTPQDLANAISNFDDSTLSLESFLQNHPDLDWKNIAQKYITLFQSSHSKL